VRTTAQEVAASLLERFHGDTLQPGDPGFLEASSIWNGMVRRTPGVILRCADVVDIQTAVRAASAAGALTAVRCGGHSLAGFSTCDGGVVIDLSRLRGVAIDESRRCARVQGGCLLGTIDDATQRVGLVFPSGVVSHTGASGLILGGGTGWLTRMLGLSCDNVEGFTVVSADGSLVRARADENPDLFWALRGGGGNFGIVTEFELKLHPLRSVLFCTAWRFGDDMHRVLRFWRDFMPEAPDELKWNISLRVAPHSPEIPPLFCGLPCTSESVVWAGDEAVGNRYLKQIFGFGEPIAVKKGVIPYLTLQTMADGDFPHGSRYYTKSGYFASLQEASIDRMIKSLDSIPSSENQLELAFLGGAAGRISQAETAFGERSTPFILNLLAHWTDPFADAANVSWIRTLFAALRPEMKPGVYVNFMSGDEENRVAEAYGGRWERLLRVKRAYDPQNFFRLNQNVAQPTASRNDPVLTSRQLELTLQHRTGGKPGV
jgi:hypothetical protein